MFYILAEMKVIINVIIFLAGMHSALFAQTPFVCEGQVYITLTNGTTSSLNQVNFDQMTGAISLDPVFPSLNIFINSIGYRNVDNLVYGINPSTYELFQIDAAGNVVVVATLPLNFAFSYLGADITDDGRYLVLIGGTEEISGGLDLELAKVDLADPSYSVTRVALTGAQTRSLDIAYDPITGILYGFDSSNRRLIIIDDETGVITAPFPSSNVLQYAGALFFNAFGDLFAYGSEDQFEQNTLISINKNTGVFTFQTTGPDASGTDGCSCPYTIEIEKTVNVETAFPCSQVIYTFSIANSSFSLQNGIDFIDVLPNGFTIVDILSNPFGGNITSGVGTGELAIEDLSIPPGVDSLQVIVEIGDIPFGRYRNQARLTDLPPTLGSDRLSDDPRTYIPHDSTSLLVGPIPFDTLRLSDVICSSDVLELDASIYGTSYIWQDNSMEATYIVTSGGMYAVTVTSPCDTTYIYYDIQQSDISVNVFVSDSEILFGDTILLTSDLVATGNSFFYEWSVESQNPSETFIGCRDCVNTTTAPYRDATYTLLVTDEFGCSDEDMITVRVETDYTIYIPNVFTPNRDGINDVIVVNSRAPARLLQFEIFDRWGNQVFKANENALTNDERFGWDGGFSLGKPYDPGVYTYVAQVRFIDNDTIILHGDITLLR